jgi:hypothetical protein
MSGLIRIVAWSAFCCLAAFTSSLLAQPEGIPTRTPGEMLRDANAKEKPQKFVPATKEQAATAIAAAKKKATEVEKTMGVTFGTIESPHFLIFTDWDKREYDFLRTNCEGAYEAVSRQFQIPVSENVFIGKLPVYMFTKHRDFLKYAKDLDQFDAPDTVAGYYQGNSLGFGHMAMWKPDIAAANGDVHLAEKRWAYVLTHEFTHAFVARYRTNAFIPRWLNEGVAEVVASRQFPRPGIYPFVRDRASKKKSIQDVFVDKGSLAGDDYPVVQTVVETMLKGNPQAFLPYFNDIKDGIKPDDALEKNYKTNLAGLEAAWRKYIVNAGKGD